MMPPSTMGRLGIIGSIAPYRSPTSRHMVTCMASANRNHPEVEAHQLGVARNGPGVVQASGNQIDGIPDAAHKDDAVENGEYRHGDAARKAALHSGGNRIDLQRKPRALHLLRRRQAHDFGRRSHRHGLGHCDHRYFFVMFMRKHLAKPSHRAGQVQNRSENTDRSVGEQPGEDQRNAQRHHERPRRRRRHDDGRRLSCSTGCFAASM